MRSKFYGIKFPIFTTRSVPEETFFRQDKMFILPEKGSVNNLVLVDDLSLDEPSYVKRLELIRLGKYTTIQYDYTCTSLSALLLSKSRWGYDSNFKSHYFNYTNTDYKLKYLKVVKTNKTAFWLTGISYPFELPSFLMNIKDLKNIWVGVVYVDFCWHIYEFSPFPKKRNRIRL